MKHFLFLAVGAVVATSFIGCETPLPPGTERGPHGTIAYIIRIEASAPGARIEVNGEVVGNSPIDVKVYGDKDGTFHDFGSYVFVIRAHPVATNQFVQTRVFGTGRGFEHQDQIPKRVQFDMNQPSPTYAPNAVPGYPYPYPYPYYPYYYGPSYRFYWGGGGYYHHLHRVP